MFFRCAAVHVPAGTGVGGREEEDDGGAAGSASARTRPRTLHQVHMLTSDTSVCPSMSLYLFICLSVHTRLSVYLYIVYILLVIMQSFIRRLNSTHVMKRNVNIMNLGPPSQGKQRTG